MALASPASAQHFGRNKVNYRTLDFQVLKTDHFDVYFYPSEREGIEIAARLAERWHARLERLFEHRLSGRQPLILYASHADFEQTNIISGNLPEGTAGVTEPIRRRIVLPLAGPVADTDHVLGHELVHAFQFDITEGLSKGGDIALSRLPLWFVEGMAEYASLGPVNGAAALRLRDATRQNKLPSIHDLNNPDYFPYHWGHGFFAYVAARYGDAIIPRLLLTAAAAGSVELAITDVLGVSVQALSTDWHATLNTLYAPAISAALPLSGARRVMAGGGLGAELNVGPALSPDGRSIAFLSGRGIFSIDLYIADVATGAIRRRLTRTATSPRYSTIQFIHSAGTWDPTGERIAVAAMIAGRAALAIFNTRTGKHDRDVMLDGVDEILHPSWSPDGRAIALTGMRQGVTDLFVYDLAESRLAQVTHDAYADIHPAWSPDSRRIVFATDRFSSDLTALGMGPYGLAIAYPATGVVEAVPVFAEGKHINPHWSPDGEALFFIADPDGVPNVYHLSLAQREIGQITFLGTGVSGITNSSPALSVSSRSAVMAVSVYENDRYDIHVRPAEIFAAPPQRLPGNAAALTLGKPEGEAVVVPQLDAPAEGLPDDEPNRVEQYKPRLRLDGFGQPSAGVGTSRFGTTVGGGVALLFTDMLGDHLLATAVQVDSGLIDSFSVKDITFEAGYYNLKRRWNWGVLGGQIPYLYGTVEREVAVSDAGEPVVVDRQIVYRQTQRSASVAVSYPFNRAQRVEFHGGLAQTTFEQFSSAFAYLPESGLIVPQADDDRRPLPSLTLATSAVALVFDSAIFGPTGPIHGQRYRFEMAPALGSINFVGVLADFRKYFMPVPFYTIAARVLHYGRYGDGSDDARLYPVYINDPSLVRGYEGLEITPGCTSIGGDLCPANGRFVGSRMLVGNLELRFPLLRPLGMSQNMYGPTPVELAVFADSGIAWTRGETPRFLGGSRSGISSAGVALRLGLGVAVAEFNITRPFQGVEDRWVLGFNFLPGW